MKREFLILARKRKKVSQHQAAEDIGISEIYLRKLEAGTSKPGRNTLVKIEQYYGQSMRELFPDIFMPENDTKGINGHA